MHKQEITYKDLDGNSVTEEFLFNLSMSEIAEMHLSEGEGYSDYLKKIVADQNGKVMIAKFKEMIRDSVGKRSEDGKRFIKSTDISDEFMQTGAYDALFMRLVTDTKFAIEFINGIFPEDLTKRASEIAQKNETLQEDLRVRVLDEEPSTETVEDTRPAWIREDREPTPAELRSMSREELQLAFRHRAESSKNK